MIFKKLTNLDNRELRAFGYLRGISLCSVLLMAGIAIWHSDPLIKILSMGLALYFTAWYYFLGKIITFEVGKLQSKEAGV